MGMLEGRVAVITGGSRGIGRATAELFAREGASLAICARNEKALKQAAEGLSAAYSTRVVSRSADILDTASVERFFGEVAAQFEKVDILINNAGESSQREVDGINWPVNAVDAMAQELPKGRFESITDDEWRRAIEQKLLGMIRVTRCALPLMRRAGSGSIVNVTSIKGRQPPPRVVTSGVGGAAAMNFSKGLSLELAGEGIRVNVRQRRRHSDRADGGRTEEVGAGEEARASSGAASGEHPAQRLGTVEEVAQTIFYLASPLSSYMTGQCMAIDGGGLRMI